MAKFRGGALVSMNDIGDAALDKGTVPTSLTVELCKEPNKVFNNPRPISADDLRSSWRALTCSASRSLCIE